MAIQKAGSGIKIQKVTTPVVPARVQKAGTPAVSLKTKDGLDTNLPVLDKNITGLNDAAAAAGLQTALRIVARPRQLSREALVSAVGPSLFSAQQLVIGKDKSQANFPGVRALSGAGKFFG